MEKSNYQSDQTNDENVLMAVVRAAEIFKRLVSSIFRKYDLSFPQYNILRVLDSSEKGQSRITDVSRIMLVPVANMTGLTKRLDKKGFIARNSDPGDDRVTLLEITSKGRATLSSIEKERDECLHTMLKGFPQHEKHAFLDQVKKLIKNSKEIT